MTDSGIKAMLKDIIDNGAEYECRFEGDRGDPPFNDNDWIPYNLGEEIHIDWGYRKVEKWHVIGNGKDGYALTNEKCSNIKQFSGTKEECEKWIEEHTKKTWLDETFPLGGVVDDIHTEGEKERLGATLISKKILEEMDKTTKERQIRDESFPCNFRKKDIEDIIHWLGVEV